MILIYIIITIQQVCPRFHAHANRIILTFDESIKTLGTDDSAALQRIWCKMATSHVKKGISRQAYNVSF